MRRVGGWAVVLAACSSPPSRTADAAIASDTSGPDAARPHGYAEWATVRGKGYRDPISEKLCAGEGPPDVHSLTGFEQTLEISHLNSAVGLTGHSTGIGLRYVTPLNPRAVIVNGADTDHFAIVTFARGEPLVEMVANDPIAQTLRFFVVVFHPQCESTATGCSLADLLTPVIENSWATYELYDRDAFVNTPLDCDTCHQPDGPGTPRILRMQERLSPWTHWFTVADQPRRCSGLHTIWSPPTPA